MNATMTEAERFFYDHAGFSHHPETETEEQGRRRGAARLAGVERRARAYGWTYLWETDDEDSSSFRDDVPAYPLYMCTLVTEAGDFAASLGAIDFGPEGDWQTDPYRRVVEAELALEVVAL